MPILNSILSAIPKNEYDRLLPKMEEVELKSGTNIFAAGGQINYVYFPNSGVVSLLTALEGHPTVDVGMIGREGVIGISALLGVNVSAGRAVVLVEGTAMRIAAADLDTAMASGGELRRLLLRFVRSILVQVSRSAACYRFHPVENRLARWLLMVSDRSGSDKLQISQLLLANMLGVRREAVNRAATSLRKKNLSDHFRGNVEILDRQGLMAAACDCYQYIRDAEKDSPIVR